MLNVACGRTMLLVGSSVMASQVFSGVHDTHSSGSQLLSGCQFGFGFAARVSVVACLLWLSSWEWLSHAIFGVRVTFGLGSQHQYGLQSRSGLRSQMSYESTLLMAAA